MLKSIAMSLPAQAAAQSGPNPWLQLVPFVVIMVAMIFIMNYSHKKRLKEQEEMITKIKVGDRVQTAGGMRGTVTQVKDGAFVVEIAPKVEVEFVRTAVELLPAAAPAGVEDKR